ncbi:hypothetical protein K2173_027924 [Erythroxylum novogranatense]|uniref:NAC domain-containing protein n=1 Tax=Erythroxylum novogranatense TaxID=1862640 RepID=A0AAV8U0B5_9ROSI|nr:hypothetical protein K2173_027924 [Erythroxylum novogranatense]
MKKMLGMEDILYELSGEDTKENGLPPGFRFHPTDEELITFYLASKVFNGSFCGVEIAEVDLNRCEPWELPDVAKMGEKEWYFFSLRDRKYPTGLRTNRATGAGYWKATGKDREVYSASNGSLLGLKKTLVFYRGRAPRGEKTKWVMHEYRLDGDLYYRHTCKEEWVICRIFHKNGEKKAALVLQGQSFFLDPSSSPCNSNSLPPLLEAPAKMVDTLQNPFLVSCNNQENDLKSLLNPFFVREESHLWGSQNKNGFQPSSSITPPASMLFKSLLSHQDCSLKEQSTTVLKQCKTEATFSHFQAPDPNFNTYQQYPLFFDMDCDVLGYLSSSAEPLSTVADITIHDMSTSNASNRDGFLMMLDHHPLLRLDGGSWPCDN